MNYLTLLFTLSCCVYAHAEVTPKSNDEDVSEATISSTESLVDALPIGGWSISGLTGLNLCLPSSPANCNNTYPGVNAGLSTEYRWHYIGVNLNLDWGNFTPSGTGSENTTNTFGHLGIGLRAYHPYRSDKHFYIGSSLGMGEAEVSDHNSDSAVQWSSWWSDLRLDLGALWFQKEQWSIESTLSMIIHNGGTRCIIFQGAGPCQALKDLDSKQQSMARILMLRFGARWTL